MKDIEKVLERAGKLGFEISVIALVCLVSLVCFLISLYAGKDIWFSSSGALIVAVCAISEFSSMSIHKKLNQVAAKSTRYYRATPEKWQVPRKRIIYDKIVLIVLVIGTLTWGYGDRLF